MIRRFGASSNSRWTKFEPTKPAPPETKIVAPENGGSYIVTSVLQRDLVLTGDCKYLSRRARHTRRVGAARSPRTRSVAANRGLGSSLRGRAPPPTHRRHPAARWELADPGAPPHGRQQYRKLP